MGKFYKLFKVVCLFLAIFWVPLTALCHYDIKPKISNGKILLTSKGKEVSYFLSDIEAFKQSSKGTKVLFTNKDKTSRYFQNSTDLILSSLKESKSEYQFLNASRNSLVNSEYVISYPKYPNSILGVDLKSGRFMPVTEKYKNDFKDLMNKKIVQNPKLKVEYEESLSKQSNQSKQPTKDLANQKRICIEDLKKQFLFINDKQLSTEKKIYKDLIETAVHEAGNLTLKETFLGSNLNIDGQIKSCYFQKFGESLERGVIQTLENTSNFNDNGVKKRLLKEVNVFYQKLHIYNGNKIMIRKINFNRIIRILMR